MEKTKLGVPATLMAAVLCLLGCYSGYLLTFIVAGYVLLKEENAFLKRMAVKVVTVLLTFSLLSTAIHFIPNILSLARSLVYVFDEYVYSEEFYNNFFNRFIDFLSQLLNLADTILLLAMAYFCAIGKELKIPVLDKFLDKHLTAQEG